MDYYYPAVIGIKDMLLGKKTLQVALKYPSVSEYYIKTKIITEVAWSC